MDSPSGLALPSNPGTPSYGTLNLPSASTNPSAPPRKRKKKKAAATAQNGRDLSRLDLDEADDVSEDEIIAAPERSRRRLDDYDEDYDEEEEEDDEEVDPDVEVEGDDGEDAEGDGPGDGDDEAGEGAKRLKEKKGKVVVGVRRKVKHEGPTAEEITQRDTLAKGQRLQLRSVMDPDQVKRHDEFSMISIKPKPINKINRDMFDQKVEHGLQPILAGMAKIFAAELVDLAKELQSHSPDPTGPLKPYHLRIARQILAEQGLKIDSGSANTGSLKPTRALFKR